MGKSNNTPERDKWRAPEGPIGFPLARLARLARLVRLVRLARLARRLGVAPMP